MLKDFLGQILSKKPLSKSEARQAMLEIISGTAEPAQTAGFLVALKMKGETADELTGFAQAMREKMIAVECRLGTPAVDLCGTGGDMKCTLNISTLASFIVASAGVPVAKHGNRSVSSKCGSADILEKLGARIDLPTHSAEKCLNDTGFAFFFAPNFHPAMKNVAPVRRSLGVPTVFNFLGPLCNPARVRRQLIGVYDPSKMEIMASALRDLGHEYALVVHSRDGMDEISPFDVTDGILLSSWSLTHVQIEPGKTVHVENASGTLSAVDIDESAKMFLTVLKGGHSAARNAALLNAAAALFISSRGESIEKCIPLAAEAVDSGRALAKLNEFIAVSNRL